jgi:hypothetical protein
MACLTENGDDGCYFTVYLPERFGYGITNKQMVEQDYTNIRLLYNGRENKHNAYEVQLVYV